MGTVESGVRKSLLSLGIKEPATALEMLAIQLAIALDNEPAENNIAALSRELILTLKQCEDQPTPNTDPVQDIIDGRENRR